MLSLLEVHPRITGTPTEPLRRATEQLTRVAETVAFQEAQARRIRNQYISKVLPHAGPPPLPGTDLGQFKLAVQSKITRTYGRKGPTENAFNALGSLATRAQSAGYPLHSPQLQEAFVNFLMAYVTEGFVGKDTTGTQMGNFQGKWRGGGF
ncbi:MAG: hypothetical protein KDJ22_00415 [Candidatus Competibacteraceae bacterium]|nr:hypothetical protein [Candidatus Competibacteraceae bacterium]